MLINLHGTTSFNVNFASIDGAAGAEKTLYMFKTAAVNYISPNTNYSTTFTEHPLHSPNFLLNGKLIDEYKADGYSGWSWMDMFRVKSTNDVITIGPHSYGFVVMEQQSAKHVEMMHEKKDSDVEEQEELSDAIIA